MPNHVLKDMEQNTTLLDVQGLKKYFPVKSSVLDFGKEKQVVKAIDDVSFQLSTGETYGLVGESGCGKSTTGRTILRLTEPTAGQATFQNQDIFQLKGKALREMNRQIQMVFQDPYSSLNPRKRIGHTLEEVLTIHSLGEKQERTDMVMDILNKVGMQFEHYYRYPHELSGGQRQRIGLARALIVNPKIIIADEPVSALDVSIQSQVLNLLNKFQREMKLTYLFISHDLSVVRHISNRIGVMYLGKIVEEAPTDQLMKNPLHPYTQALLASIPLPNPKLKRERIILKGELPSPLKPPTGCVFHTRCPHVVPVCQEVLPLRKEIAPGHSVACHLYI